MSIRRDVGRGSIGSCLGKRLRSWRELMRELLNRLHAAAGLHLLPIFVVFCLLLMF